MIDITGYSRYRPELKWSNLYVSNIFRVYEQIFGRRVGIRHDISKNFETGVHAAHSFEGVCALIETYIRDILKLRKLIKVRIWIPVLMTPQGLPVFASPYLFAIAVNAGTLSDITSTWTSGTLVTAGSNVKVIASYTGAVAGTDNITASTYNSVALTKIGGVQKPSDRFIDAWYIDTASVGSLTLAVTTTGSTVVFPLAASYSGCDTGIDSSNTSTASAASTLTTSTTVVAANCWLVGGMGNGNGTQTAGTGTTLRVDVSANTGSSLVDSNGTVSTGSQSLIVNRAGSNLWGGVIASIKPFIGTAVNSGFFFAASR